MLTEMSVLITRYGSGAPDRHQMKYNQAKMNKTNRESAERNPPALRRSLGLCHCCKG
jgi:hypothetical protein